MVALTEMTNWAVDLIDVRKTYPRNIQALRGVNIQVGRGEIFGLLGPNGAGKTTLVKIMMTVVRPTRAMGTIMGRPIGHRGKLAKTGYLPENHRFPGYLTGLQLLDYYAALAKVPRAVRRVSAPKLLDQLGLSKWCDTRIDKYSKGMMQRLGIAQALMNDPELIVLDEPTDGLDPVGRRDVRQLLLELRRAGKTVFLNSHLLSELEMVCDRVAILVDGLVARQGTLSELTEHTVEYRITFSGDPKPIRAKLAAFHATVDGDLVVLSGQDSAKVNSVIDLLRGQGLLIESVQPHRFSLEDILVEAMAGPAPNERAATVRERIKAVSVRTATSENSQQMQFWALIVDSFRESRDRKIFWVMLGLSVLVAAAMFCFSFEQGKVNVLFGMWVIKTDYFTSVTGLKTELIAALVVDGIMDTALGGMGVLLSIIATASFFPTFLERGAIDVVLCKPLPRWKLFLGRYVGGMVFMGVQATIFVVLTFLVVGLRWGVWLPGYLMAIPLVVLLFSYLYCISAFVALVTRSTVASVLLTMLAWMAFTGIQTVDDLFTVMFPDWQEHKLVYEGVHTLRWIVPKTQDITYIAKKWSRAANASIFVHADNDEDREIVDQATKIEVARRAMNPLAIIGSSLFFEAVIVLLAMWKFTRKDY